MHSDLKGRYSNEIFGFVIACMDKQKPLFNFYQF